MKKVWSNSPANFSKYIIHTDNGCHNWTGKIERSGYGRVSWLGKRRLAHRVAAHMHGLLPDLNATVVVMHLCDNRLCCNPNHLRIGSQADNMRDAVAKGRMKFPNNRGTRSAHAKLSQADVTTIRERYAAGGISQAAIGKQYGVSQMVISRLIRKISYHE